MARSVSTRRRATEPAASRCRASPDRATQAAVVDRELLEDAAGRCWPGATLGACHLLPADASARTYVRLELLGGAAPPTCLAMLLPPGGAGRACEEITSGAVATELPFANLQRFLRQHGVAVPEIFLIDEGRGVLLEEDLGDLPLADALLADPARRPALLREAADLLAGMASLVALADPSCVAFHDRYDGPLIARELEVSRRYGLAPIDAVSPLPADADPEIDRLLRRLGDAIGAQPLVLMHRDYHAWNLHLDPRGRLRLLDFQDAVLGPALYDLASLASDRDSDRFIGQAEEDLMLEAWAAGLARRGFDPGIAAHELRKLFLEAVAYRTLRVIGRFQFLAMEKGKTSYLRFLPRMAQRSRRALEESGDAQLAAALAERSVHFR